MTLIESINKDLLKEVKDIEDMDHRFYEIVDTFQERKIKELKDLMDYLYSDSLSEEAQIYVLRKKLKKFLKKSKMQGKHPN